MTQVLCDINLLPQTLLVVALCVPKEVGFKY